MWIEYLDHLNTLLATNQPDKAIEEIRKSIREFKREHPDQIQEIDQLERQIILHSARMRELSEKERNIQLSSSEIDVARSKMFSALLGIISSMDEYPSFKEFLAEKGSIEVPKAPPAAASPTMGGFSGFSSPVHDPIVVRGRGTMFGVVGAIVGVVVAVTLFWLIGRNSTPVVPNSSNNSPSISSATAPVPEGQQFGIQEESEEVLWEEIKATATIDKLDLFLEKFPEGPHAVEAQTLRSSLVQKRDEQENDLWEIVQGTNTVEMYNFYLRSTRLGTFNGIAEKRRDSLAAGMSESNRYEALLAAAQADTLSIQDKISIWKSAGEEFTGQHLQEIQAKVQELRSVMEQFASVKEEDNLVLCTSVSDQFNPVNVAEIFQLGSVYAWARIHAPRRESIKVAWYGAGNEILNEKSITVEANTGLGYRIFHNHRYATPGRHEVRIFNQENHLIGRRVFEVR